MPDDPFDEDIVARLRRAPAAAWDELWDAFDRLDHETTHLTWAGGEQVGTTVVGGVERPVMQIPYAVYSEAVSRLVQHLYEVGVVVPFDWAAWDGRERYACGQGIDEAPVADAVRLLTAYVRGERACEGTLGTGLVDGTLVAALHRLRRWHDDED